MITMSETHQQTRTDCCSLVDNLVMVQSCLYIRITMY